MEVQPFREEDYEALCRFLIGINRPGQTRINWNWARFEWMYEHPEFDKSAGNAIGLWREGEEIVGAAIYDMYFGEAFCGALPGYEALYPAILDYAWAELRDDKGLGISLDPADAPAWAAARAAGFVPAEQRETVLGLDLEGLSPTPLPTGYRLLETDPVRDAEIVLWTLWQGFDHGSDRAEFARETEIVPQTRRHFDPRLSLAALDPAGEPAAYCCLWYRPDTDYAYVEPVCTVPAHRGRGLAGALLTEAAVRAGRLGAKQAFYRRLGFGTERVFPFLWKKL